MANAPIRVIVTAQSPPDSFDKFLKCSVAISAASLTIECVIVAVDTYAQFQPCAKT